MPNKPKQKPFTLYGVYSNFLHFDMFAQAQSFEVEGERYYRTTIGSLMSCLILMIVAPYVVKRYSIMTDYKDTRYSTSNRQNKFINEHLDIENGITFEEAQFKMAYRIDTHRLAHIEVNNKTSIDLVMVNEDDWRNYFDLGLKYRWYAYNTTHVDNFNEDIPVHPCGDFTEEGFDEPDPRTNIIVQKNYNNGMMCIDDNDKYKLFGRQVSS